MKPRATHRLALATALSLGVLIPQPALAAPVTGRVVDQDTDEVLAKVSITVLGSSPRKDVTDKQGAFSLGDLPAGTYVLLVERSGYSPQKLTVTVGESAKKLQIGLASKVYEAAEVSVNSQTPSLKRPTVSQTTVEREELKQIPGSWHDPLKAAVAMPGVAPSGAFVTSPTVRGGGPGDNAFYLDRFELGNPFHFGGFVSAINGNMIERFTLYTGAYPARYGNATSGIFELESRAPRTDRVGGTFDTNLLWSSLYLEGPVMDTLSFSLSGRRSYLDLIVGKGLPDFTAFPRFDDYMGRLQWRPDARNTVTALAFGSDDYLDMKMPASASVDSGMEAIRWGMGSTTLGLSWKSSVTDWLASDLTISRNTYSNQMAMAPNANLNTDSSAFNAQEDLSLRVLDRHEVGLGIRHQAAEIKMVSNFPLPPNPPDAYAGKKWNEIPRLKVDNTYTAGMASVYAEDRWKLLDPLTMTLGLRQDRLTQSGKSAVSPRFGLAYRPDDDTTLRLGWGQFYAYPFTEKTSPGFGNPGLDYEHAMHSVAGIERQFGDRLLGKLEIYHKQLDQLAAPDPTRVFANTGGGFARGVELSTHLKPSALDLPLLGRVDGISGQLSYTYGDSKRWDTPGGAVYDYDYSQPHVLTLLMNYPLPMGWKGGLKWRYLSGTPYTPYVGRTQDPTTQQWLPVRGDRNSQRLPDANQVDLRFERKGTFFWREANYYIDVLNAFNQKQVIGYTYAQDFSNFDRPQEQTGLPIIPFVGVELAF